MATTRNGWKELPIIPQLDGLVVKGTSSWFKGHLKILFSPKERHTETDVGGGYWKHLSISHPKRYPFWDEILDARYTFFSDKETVIQILPPKGKYVNYHPNCFHLWSKIID